MADMYEQLYQAKLNEIKKKKDQGLADLATEEQGVNNTYTDLYNTLNTKQQDAATEYYGQRNQAAVSNAQNVQQIRDWMAKNNLLQSGESADQLMRSNTDFSNEVGRIKSNESSFNRDILNQRSNANREQAQKIADILNRRRLSEEEYVGNENALRSEVEYQRLQDQQAREVEERQYQRQLALQRQSQAASAARSKSSSANSAAEKALKAQQEAIEAQRKEYNSKYNTYLDYGYKMIQDEDGNYDNDTMVNWVSNLDMPDDYKVNLLNVLNLQKPALPAINPLNGSTADAWRMMR